MGTLWDLKKLSKIMGASEHYCLLSPPSRWHGQELGVSILVGLQGHYSVPGLPSPAAIVDQVSWPPRVLLDPCAQAISALVTHLASQVPRVPLAPHSPI